MKAVIVDLLGGQAAALCDDGRVVKLPDAGYTLGQRVEVHERQRRTRPGWLRAVSSVAAAAVLVLAVGGTAWALPYGVVSLDVNPSIEYTINCFDYVLSVDGVNEDGRSLLAQMDRKQLVHRRIGDALSASVEQLEAGEGPGGEILLAAAARKSAHAERLLGELERDLSGRRGGPVHTVTASREELDKARREGVSVGREHVLRELSEQGDYASEDWAGRPVAELWQELENSRRGHNGHDERQDGEGSGHDRPGPPHAHGAAADAMP